MVHTLDQRLAEARPAFGKLSQLIPAWLTILGAPMTDD